MAASALPGAASDLPAEGPLHLHPVSSRNPHSCALVISMTSARFSPAALWGLGSAQCPGLEGLAVRGPSLVTSAEPTLVPPKDSGVLGASPRA